jgi:RND superfamily putative drug exporter
MDLLGDCNRWMPRWLDRLLPHLNTEGHDSAPEPTPDQGYDRTEPAAA